MESSFSQLTHGVSLVTTITILGILLKEHKVWIRLKDRMDTLWAAHCARTGEKFKALENGHD